MTHNKRLPAPKHYPIARKESTYISSIEGSRSKDAAIPAVVLLRDVLGYAENEKDAKKIIQDRNLVRNGEPVTSVRQGIGVLDVVEIPETEESYRVIRNENGLEFISVNEPEKVISKIVGKQKEEEEYVYRLHNGENYRSEDEYSTGNSLIFNSSVREIKLEEGAKVLVIGGGNAGLTAELKEIRRQGRNPDIAVVENNGEQIETLMENLVAVDNIEVGDN